MILVAGGSGRLGSLLVQRLVAGGATVRVLGRTRARAAHLDAAPVEIVEGDVRVASDAQRAVAGANVVVSAVHGFAGPGGVSPASVDRDGNRHLVDAAARAGATVILMSVVGASAESPMELFRMKDAAEQYLRASGTQWTIVRSTAFLETWIDLIADTADRAGRVVVFGRGQNPINFISVHDVALLVDRVIGEPDVDPPRDRNPGRGSNCHTAARTESGPQGNVGASPSLLAGTRTSRSGRPRARHDGSALRSHGRPRAISGHFAHLNL